MAGKSAQEIHDELLRVKPEGVVHEPCDLCPGEVANSKEVAKVADDRTYTEAEHTALMADAVRRETAELTGTKDSLEKANSDLTSRVDVLEAEKASAEKSRDDVQKEFDDFKADIERAKAVEDAKKDRLDRVKAAAEHLPDTYFTDERIQRWAEMSDESFTTFVADLTDVTPTTAVKETAAFNGGQNPTGKTDKVTPASIFTARRNAQK